MITNFEEITTEITAQELLLIPTIVQSFKKYTINNPIKSDEICLRFNNSKVSKINLDGPRLRKIVHYIRKNSLLPLIATSKGYYVSDDVDEIKKQINSLTERANSNMECANGLKKFIK